MQKNDILTGIVQPKGRVHIEFCPQITIDDLSIYNSCTNNEYHKKVAELIDSRINAGFKLTPNNYIAHDLRYGQKKYIDKYTEEFKSDNVNEVVRLLSDFERSKHCEIAIRDNLLKHNNYNWIRALYDKGIFSEERITKKIEYGAFPLLEVFWLKVVILNMLKDMRARLALAFLQIKWTLLLSIQINF